MNTTINPTIVAAKKATPTTPATKAKKMPERIEIGRNVRQWNYTYIYREDLPDRLPRDAEDVAEFPMTPEEEKVYYDRVWAELVDRAGYAQTIELEEEDGDTGSIDGDDDEFNDLLWDAAGCVDEEVKKEKAEEAKKKAEEEAKVVVPVVPEKTREELLAEIDRLTAELDAIKARMRKAMEDLGY